MGAGQPPYDPADLLQLYLYGYLNQIRSSRRLEREAGRNVELMWLLGGLVPGYRTIAKFRAENADALRQTNRDFVLILRKLGLVGDALVAIDGAFFDGNASKASIVTRKRLVARLTRLDGALAEVASEIAAAENETARAGRFGLDDFSYNAEADAYTCPAGNALPAMQGGRKDVTGKFRIKYASRATQCADCPLRAQCLAPKANLPCSPDRLTEKMNLASVFCWWPDRFVPFFLRQEAGW